MADFLDKLEIKDISKKDSPVSVSLESLLLLDEQDKVSSDLQKTNAGSVRANATSPSRKARRKKIKSNKVVSKSSNDSAPSSEQIRLTKQFQEKNKKALLAREKQSNQTSRSGSVSKRLQSSNSISRNEKNAKSSVLTYTKRPVVLGALDYIPVSSKIGSQESSVNNLISLKRSAKKIKLDKLVRPIIEDPQFKTPEIASTLSKYAQTKEKFFSSLVPSTLEGYADILSYFGLTLTNNVSNSEIIYTIMRELADATIYATSRLDESPDRSVDGDISLVKKKDKTIEMYYSALTISHVGAYTFFRFADKDDIEIATKCLLSIFAKEIVYSYNISKKELEEYNPIVILQTKEKKDVLSHPPKMDDKYYRSAHGMMFNSITSGDFTNESTNNYPLELAQIIQQNQTTKSSTDFILQLINGTSEYSTRGSESFDTPYKAISDSYSTANEDLLELTDSKDLSPTQTAYVDIMNMVLRELVLSLQESLSSADRSLQCNILKAASKNSTIFENLLVYLAFREERTKGISQNALDSISYLVRSDAVLKAVAGSASTGTVTKSFSVSPQTISLDPGIDGQTEFTAPANSTTATLETPPSDTESASLESIFGVTFEDVCDNFAAAVQGYLYSSTNNQADITVEKTVSAIPLQISSCLQNTTAAGSLFDFILNWENIIDEFIPDSEEVSIFSSSSNTTRFSKIPKRNLIILFSSIVSKMTAILMDSKSKVISPPLPTTTTTTIVKTAPPSIKTTPPSTTPSLSPAIYAAPSIGINANVIQAVQEVFVRMQYSSDYSSSLLDLESYLDNDVTDFSDISNSYPLLASIGASLLEEEKVVGETSKSLDAYFRLINHSFEDVRKILETKLSGGLTLRQKILAGLVPSLDSARLLESYSYSLNSKNMIYNNSKMKDTTISPDGSKMMIDHCSSSPTFLNRGKVFAVAIPAGLLEEVSNPPSEIEYIRANSALSYPDIFTLKVQKIDQANPEIKYNDIEFRFSRSLFLIDSNKATPEFVVIDKDLTAKDLTAETVKATYGSDIYNNHLSSIVLKQYSSNLLDLDFFENSFPVNKDHSSALLEGKIDIPAFGLIDSSTVEFLSSSNLAFDESNRNIDSFSFYDKKTGILDTSFVPADEYEYSIMDYLNSYGSFFIPDAETKKMQDGLQFERILCVLVNDGDFKIDTTSTASSLRSKGESEKDIRAQIDSIIAEQKMVSIGVETSSGVDLNTYRFVVSVGEV
jgi:hypothetical protein